MFYNNEMVPMTRRYLRTGTVLVPKPEWLDSYKKINWTEYVVTEKDEAGNATIGERWMIKPIS